MGLLDNDTVIVDAILTKLGRQKLANGQPLDITQYTFGATGVDYTLYNPNHPSGSDSYGTAITSLPMLQAEPDDNVFMRSKLYGAGERNIQNFSFITVENTSITITKVAGETESNAVTIIPTVFPRVREAIFDFKILDIRGLDVRDAAVLGEAGERPSFDYPDPVVANVLGQSQISINARPQQITSQRTVGVEITREGAAPVFITLTIQQNNIA